MFGKVKTIVLPGNDSSLKEKFTIEEYKEFSGIDLRDLIVLTDTDIDLNPKAVNNALILVEFQTSTGATILVPAISEPLTNYEAGVNPAKMQLKYIGPGGNVGCGILFTIPAEKAFDISNLEVQVIEI